MSKFIILTEIYEETGPEIQKNVTGTGAINEKFTYSTSYNLRKVILNSEYIASLKEELFMNIRLHESKQWPSGLDTRQGFTKIQMSCKTNSLSSGNSLIVIGDLNLIASKLSESLKND